MERCADGGRVISVARTALIALAVAIIVPSAAYAVADCGRTPEQRVLVSGLGTLESVIADDRGHLFFTDADAGQLLRMDRRSSRAAGPGRRDPGARRPRLPARRLACWSATATRSATASRGIENPQAGLIRVDPRTGANRLYADGLTMANGVARGPDGAIYASNDVGIGDRPRARRDGSSSAGRRSPSSNGLVVDSSGRYALRRPDVRRLRRSRGSTLADPPTVEPWFQAPPADDVRRARRADPRRPRQPLRRRQRRRRGLAGRRRSPAPARSRTCRRSGPSAVAFGTAPGKDAPPQASAVATST